jgi:hypothetical protein
VCFLCSVTSSGLCVFVGVCYVTARGLRVYSVCDSWEFVCFCLFVVQNLVFVCVYI